MKSTVASTFIALLCVVSPILVSPVLRVHAAEDPSSSIAQVLARNGFRVAFEGASTQSVRHLQVRWSDIGTEVSATQIGELRLQEARQSDEMLPRQRSQQIQSGQLLVVILDRAQVIRFWRIVADPRASFTETTAPTGRLTKTTTQRDDTLNIVVPAAIELGELRLLNPSWSEAGQLELAPIATLSIPPDVMR